MDKITSFREYLRLSEAGMVQPALNPAMNTANSAIKNSIKPIANNNPNASPLDIIKTAALDPVERGTVKPGVMAQVLDPTQGQPGQQKTTMMMRKNMKKGMRKR